MNRRDALKTATGIAGLISGTMLSADQPADDQVLHPNLSWGPQPNYFVLYVFQHGPVNDFIPIGIYTKKGDAEDHESRAKAAAAAAKHYYAGAIVPRSHEELCYDLADKRLAAIADHIRGLMNLRTPIDALPKTADLASLYARAEFPAAVAKRNLG